MDLQITLPSRTAGRLFRLIMGIIRSLYGPGGAPPRRDALRHAALYQRGFRRLRDETTSAITLWSSLPQLVLAAPGGFEQVAATGVPTRPRLIHVVLAAIIW